MLLLLSCTTTCRTKHLTLSHVRSHVCRDLVLFNAGEPFSSSGHLAVPISSFMSTGFCPIREGGRTPYIAVFCVSVWGAVIPALILKSRCVCWTGTLHWPPFAHHFSRGKRQPDWLRFVSVHRLSFSCAELLLNALRFSDVDSTSAVLTRHGSFYLHIVSSNISAFPKVLLPGDYLYRAHFVPGL